MPTSSLGFDNFYSTTLSSSISDTDTTIPVTSPPTATEGYLVIEPETAANREIIYYTSVSGNNVVLPDVGTGRGVGATSAIAHASGATVKMNVTAEHFDYLRDLFNTTEQGWTALTGTHSVSSTYNAGNRSFTIATSADHSSILSEGMRYKVTRNTTPPTQCADLEASSSHYASKSSPTGITFTDDFTCEAWIKLESYTGTNQIIISRFNGTSGWQFAVGNNGQLIIYGFNAGGGNYRGVESYQSVPLGKWVHVAIHLDMSGSNDKVLIDGVNVPGATYTAGTNPTALVQAGNLELGSRNGGLLPFDGKLADVRVWSDLRTDTEIQDNMYAYPSDTTGLVAHFKLNGDFTDSSSNGNDLTAQNSAVATDADNPWNATEYGIITNVTSSTIQVFCPEGYGIPNETLTAPFYSTQSTPYGFPRGRDKWALEVQIKSDSANSTTANAWQDSAMDAPQLPVGVWTVAYKVRTRLSTTSGDSYTVLTLSTDTSTETNPDLTSFFSIDTTNASTSAFITHSLPESPITVTTQTTFNVLLYQNTTSVTIHRIDGDTDYASGWIRAYCAYL